MTATASWISKRPDRCGGDACVRETRIPVWLLVEWQRRGKDDAWILEGYPTLTQQDLEAAWAYDAEHREEIDEAIRSNAEA
jgi:uncharacterized protein (DUF433 family)